ncbi:hypothetical protein BDV29DRAFT_169222 [Aspergillus leporis]|uniref:Transmembrane protein n=1 Tax=Aspergillus leporis TaxID=41062 RepID=A0A5N5X818_9EURO|nr:hypothetical protein BDV29DRAFT_169222 [Aspergillus leporis]
MRQSRLAGQSVLSIRKRTSAPSVIPNSSQGFLSFLSFFVFVFFTLSPLVSPALTTPVGTRLNGYFLPRLKERKRWE